MSRSTAVTKKHVRPKLRRINLRFVWMMLVLSLVAGAGVGMLHRYRLQQFAGVWRQQMQAALRKGEINTAIQACTRYLALYPNDTETLVELGTLLDENAASGSMLMQAYLTLETALRQDPGRDDVRRRLVDVAVKPDRHSDALAHVEILRRENATDPDLIYQAGVCSEGMGKFRDAALSYHEAVASGEAKIEYFTRLAGLILRRPEELDLKEIDPLNRDGASASEVAAQIMDEAVGICRPAHLAYLARADFRRSQGDLDGAGVDIQKALELAEDDTDVLLAAANLEVEQADLAAAAGQVTDAAGHREMASKYAQRGLDRDLRLYVILARVLVDTGKRSEAITLLRESISRIPAFREKVARDQLVQTMLTERQLLFILADELISQAIADDQANGADRFKEPKELLASLKKLSLTEPLVAFLEGRIFAANRLWHEAAGSFEQARRGPNQLFVLTRRIDLQLSACYRALENPDLRIVALRRAVTTDPLWIGGRIEFANALSEAGFLFEAIDEYSALTRVTGVPLILARLLTLQQITRSADVRDWTKVNQMLDLARQTTPEDPEIPVLEAELLTQQQDIESAANVLQEARSRFPDVVAIPVAQSLVALRQSDAESQDRIAAALKILDEATMQLGRKVELDLARAEVTVQVSGTDGQRMVQSIQASETYDDELKVRLYQGLARAADQLKSPELAVGYWKQITALRPSDLRAHLEIASRSRTDEAAWNSELEAIRRIEGPEGPNGDFEEAVTLLERIFADGSKPVTADSSQMKNLTTARQLLSRAAAQRPRWAAVVRAMGKLEEVSGNADAAFEQFRTALELGDRSREFIMTVVQGYMQQKRFDEADQELRKLAENQPELISGDLARMAWAVAWERNQADRAIEMADRVAEETHEYRDQIWLSELRFARGRRGVEVEEPLEEAIRLAPTAPEPWFAKVAYLVRMARIDDAEATIQQASGNIREDASAITVARCYELISEFSSTEKQFLAEAEKSYLKAFETRPEGDMSRVITIADFYVRHAEFDKAEEYLDLLLDPQTAAPDFALEWARRRQAMLIASRGGCDDTQRALRMLQENMKPGTKVSADDLRTSAEILSQRPIRSDRIAAIRLLEELEQRKQQETADSFLLAMLYEETGNWTNSRKIMLSLLSADSVDPAHVAFFVQRLIRHDELNDAELWMNKLEELQPKTFRTVVTKAKLLGALHQSSQAVPLLTGFIKDRRSAILGLPELLEQENADDAMEVMRTWLADSANPNSARILLQVRELLQQNKTDQAVAILREYVNEEDLGDATHAAIIRVAADLLEEIGEFTASEDLFRQYVKLSTKQEAAFILAKFLARQGRVNEALAVCEKQLETGTPDLIAAATASVVSHGNVAPEQLKKVESWILAAAERQPESLVCGIALADLQLLQHRFEEAEQLYRSILAVNDRHLVALNNLAWLLANTPGRSAQSLELINRAMVYLASGQTSEAVKDLKEAFEGSDSAIGYLHLALAYLKLGDRESAESAMTEAEGLGLQPNGLHPLEREKYDQVRKGLADQSG